MELPHLPERPKAEVLSVETILDHARAGRLRVPRFQTGLRWTSKHVVELFDSIERGFPVGSLLLWKRPTTAGVQSFGPLEVQAPSLPDALFLVDGQQRVTALAGALLHPDRPPLGGPYAIWVNLVTGGFAAQRTHPGQEWLPLNVLGDRVRLLQWSRTFSAGEATEALVERAFDLHRTVLTYQIPAYVVSDAAPDVLKLIFSRVNGGGVQLDAAQVFEALFGGEDEGHPLAEMGAALETATRFGLLPPDWLLRCAKAVAQVHPRLDFSESHRPSADLIARTQDALRRAILLLVNEAWFLHASILPYRSPLIVLARFFDEHPDPHPRNRTLLVRWLWRGALSGRHGDSSNASMAAQLADIDGDESRSVQRLLARVPREVDPPLSVLPWVSRAAATRLYAVLLLREWIEHLDVPVETVQSALNEHEIGEIFRPLLARDTSIAARVVAIRGVPVTTAVSPEEARALLLSNEALDALATADGERFLSYRGPMLDARMWECMFRFAGLGESDRPPIRDILAAAGT